MPSDVTKPRKAFLISAILESGEVSTEVAKATVETFPSPMYAKAPEVVRDLYDDGGFSPDGLKLRMPDGSEWYIDDRDLETVMRLVREHREHIRSAA